MKTEMLMKDTAAFRRELGHSRTYLSTWSWAMRQMPFPGFSGEQRPVAALSSITLQYLVMPPKHSHPQTWQLSNRLARPYAELINRPAAWLSPPPPELCVLEIQPVVLARNRTAILSFFLFLFPHVQCINYFGFCCFHSLSSGSLLLLLCSLL